MFAGAYHSDSDSGDGRRGAASADGVDEAEDRSLRNPQRKAWEVGLLALAIVVFAVQAIVLAREDSLCNDEGKHLATGWWLLMHREGCLGVDNSPLTALYALPLLPDRSIHLPPGMKMGTNAHLAGYFLIFKARDPESVIFRARLMSVLLGSVMLVLLWRVARRWFGPAGGLLPVFLTALDPNVVAHFSLISTDALLTFSVVLVVFILDWRLRRPSLSGAAWIGAGLGIAVLAKYTGLLLIPLAVGVVPLYRTTWRDGRAWKQGAGLRFLLQALAIGVGAAVLVVWIGYGAHIGASPPFLRFPGFLTGFEQASAYARYGMPAYFCGKVGTGWPAYFLYVLFLKVPLPLLLLWGGSIVAACRPAGRRLLRERPWIAAPLLLAAIFYGVCLRSRLNIGVRHMLQCFPLLALFTGVLFSEAFRRGARLVRAAVVGTTVWLAVEAAWFFPLDLSYFNELAGGPAGGMRYLGDSNIDWGQDLKRLAVVLKQSGIDEILCAYLGNTDPAFYGIRYQEVPIMFFSSAPKDYLVGSRREILAVSVNNLQGTLYEAVGLHDPFGWLRKRKWFARAGYSIYLYDITGDPDAHRRLARIYRAFSMDVLAQKEEAKAAAYAGVRFVPASVPGESDGGRAASPPH